MIPIIGSHVPIRTNVTMIIHCFLADSDPFMNHVSIEAPSFEHLLRHSGLLSDSRFLEKSCFLFTY